MSVAALITWVITAFGGLVMFGTWLVRGGLANQPRTAREMIALPPPYFPAPLIFAHFVVAVIGLVVWAAYVISHNDVLADIALVLLLPVGVLGFSMFGRWLGSRRARLAVYRMVAGAVPAESHLPLPLVLLHGIAGSVTLLLVVLSVVSNSG